MKTPCCQNPLLLLLWGMLFLHPGMGHTQNLSFSNPIHFLAGKKTDKAIDIAQFKNNFFVTWKEPGATGTIHVCYLGKQYDTSFIQHEYMLPSEQTAFAPVLRVLNDRIYLLWISPDGSVKYILGDSDSSFDSKNVRQLAFKNGAKLAFGITSASIGQKLLIASHAQGNARMVYAITSVENDGSLEEAGLMDIPDRKSDDYPFVVPLSDTVARFTYKGHKEQGIYFADLNIGTGHWSDPTLIPGAGSAASPAIYSVLRSGNLFYIWKGPKNDNRIYYAAGSGNVAPSGAFPLPVYFSTRHAVSICKVDDSKFILAYIGEDQQFYLSYFTNYHPESWMKDWLLVKKGDHTLKDIVLPGAHDAGMSVLSGVGGTQSGSINECNTLTQTQGISDQLKAGIRMFDLRVGTFNNALYTKHCAADCMEDAIGGGYGEKLNTILTGIKSFLHKNDQEFVLVTFSHFCEKETPVKDLADSIVDALGKDLLFSSASKSLEQVRLKDLAGKVVVVFEGYARADGLIDSSTMQNSSLAFINFRREYAATNDINGLTSKEEVFFGDLKNGAGKNDLIRLDWQLTQSSDEAAMVCNDFQDEKTNPLINGAMLLTNVIRKHQSIIDQAVRGNRYLAVKMNEWIANGIITAKNKPNILYVDVAGGWITDYCIGLNNSGLYK